MSTHTRTNIRTRTCLDGRFADLMPAGAFLGALVGTAVALALAAAPAAAQTQDRVDLQQIETVPAGPSDVTAAPDPSADVVTPAEEGTTEAGAEVDQNVQAAERDPGTGQVEAADPGARPTENWFGCKPDADGKMDQCEEGAGEGAGQAAAEAEGQSASQ